LSSLTSNSCKWFSIDVRLLLVAAGADFKDAVLPSLTACCPSNTQEYTSTSISKQKRPGYHFELSREHQLSAWKSVLNDGIASPVMTTDIPVSL
jgi:hypothetical protein